MRLRHWQDLEDEVQDLLLLDSSKKPANSGGTKKEEDVVSKNIIAQCKYTDTKNMSILNKDLERLISACELQDKFPMFFTSNGNNTVISIPYNDDTACMIKNIMTFLISFLDLIKCYKALNSVQDISELNIIKKRLSQNIGRAKLVFSTLKETHKQCENKIEIKTNDILLYDLFEGEI